MSEMFSRLRKKASLTAAVSGIWDWPQVRVWVFSFPVLLLGCVTEPFPTAIPTAPRDATVIAGLEFLKREVPLWKKENGCFSCHNNGDGARALYAAGRAGYEIHDGLLSETTDWLSSPNRWDSNKGDPGFSDQRLADLQFGLSLLAAVEGGFAESLDLQDLTRIGTMNRLRSAGLRPGRREAPDVPGQRPALRFMGSRTALKVAAARVARGQEEDGSWNFEPQSGLGSPVTYGAALATFMAWRVLDEANWEGPELAKGRLWLGSLSESGRPGNLPATAVGLMAGAAFGEVPRSESIKFLRSSQDASGGWGPYADSPPEVFDTAIVLLALRPSGLAVEPMISKGRDYLVRMQSSDGSWPATTRPSGGESYAQMVSTTAWAVLALLATER